MNRAKRRRLERVAAALAPRARRSPSLWEITRDLGPSPMEVAELARRAALNDATPKPGTTDVTPAVMAARVEPERAPVKAPAPPPEPTPSMSWCEEHLGRGNRILGPEPEIPWTNGRALTEYDCLDDEWDE